MEISIPPKTFHVYLLIDDLDDTRPDGVFYVGFGRKKRLRSTIKDANKSEGNIKKAQKIREMWDQGREPRLKIVYSSDSEYKARACEDFLIKKYGHHLTNHQGLHSKYPEYIFYEGHDPEENVLIPIQMPDIGRIVSAVKAAKELHAQLDTANSKEVLTFLLDLQRQFYPGTVEEEPPTELAKIARKALMDDGSHLFMHIIARTMTRREQDRWLDGLARKVIELTLQSYRNRGRYPNKEQFRELGYKHIETTDIDMLIIRLKRAGYISRRPPRT